jgi:hypothetical protein
MFAGDLLLTTHYYTDADVPFGVLGWLVARFAVGCRFLTIFYDHSWGGRNKNEPTRDVHRGTTLRPVCS